MTTVFDVLQRPIITEKSNYQVGELNQYVFEVKDGATKNLVKDAIETLYDVTVEKVNIINVPAKVKRDMRRRRKIQRRAAFKKAIVTLAPGDTLQIFEGVR